MQSIERAAAILQVVAGSGGTLGVTDIAEAVGLAKTTTHSLLRTLLLVGFVDQDRATGRYALGTRLLRLGPATSTSTSCAPGRRTGPTPWPPAAGTRCGLATLDGDDVVVVHHVFRPTTPPRCSTSGPVLPTPSALGKVLTRTATRTGHRRPAPAAPPTELAEVRAARLGTARGEVEHRHGRPRRAGPRRRRPGGGRAGCQRPA